MLSFYLIWSLSYCTLLWWMSRFWQEKEDFALAKDFSPDLTLIVPFRNEAKNVARLSLNLKRLRYPNLEILLVDDQSEDDSFQLLEKSFEDYQHVQVLRSPSKGKKSAIEYGVQIAVGEIILCTDADCVFPEFWVEKMVLPFQNPNVQLVAGAVMVEEKAGFLEKFQSIDWSSILLMTNYYFATQSPLMCSGANLAYRKSAFWEVNAYEGNLEFASGDDEFLLKKICKAYGKDACFYLSSVETLVRTKPESTWETLINQRVRWASKWKVHFSASHAISASLAFLIQLVWIGSISLMSLGGKGILAFGLVWLIKVFGEKISLGKVLKSLGSQPSTLMLFQTSFVHPFYVMRVGIGALRGKFTWKGREN
ncbi:glycosyltransferase [Algoriphagus chordae]|uniref:Cellulose synthase/poly-beta-1,6-N-acetylglucosamine synthase-like glycosyltransferase n=1 Tax=Algoriphagus chordae TaxID=237019 RepID=A0A2W7R6R5_9BACT|nr:glycosyltransferase [Algoriphagus chordae]PZX56563.1 cellulose synthase/poly-beta-1,6-N-acetylglucosamine synthase-like glycosyltransferase [Algoriphagus chordae]